MELDHFISALKKKQKWAAHLAEGNQNFIKLVRIALTQEQDDIDQDFMSTPKKEYVDILLVKLLGLLLCRGDQRYKSEIWFDAMMGQALVSPTYMKKIEAGKVDRDHDKITWKNPRLIQSVRSLIYFSEILPKKYYDEFMSNHQIPDLTEPTSRHSKVKQPQENTPMKG